MQIVIYSLLSFASSNIIIKYFLHQCYKPICPLTTRQQSQHTLKQSNSSNNSFPAFSLPPSPQPSLEASCPNSNSRDTTNYEQSPINLKMPISKTLLTTETFSEQGRLHSKSLYLAQDKSFSTLLDLFFIKIETQTTFRQNHHLKRPFIILQQQDMLLSVERLLSTLLILEEI